MSPGFSSLLNTELMYSLNILIFFLHLHSLSHMADAQDILNDLTVYFCIDLSFIMMIHVLKIFIENSIIIIINFLLKED